MIELNHFSQVFSNSYRFKASRVNHHDDLLDKLFKIMCCAIYYKHTANPLNMIFDYFFSAN